VKDQYFGDVNDFRKYGLLRSLAVSSDLRVGVCWMLTESKPDGRDGKSLSYLDKPEEYRRFDPDLFDWLKRVVRVEKDRRRTALIEKSEMLGSALFYSKPLPKGRSDREEYCSECAKRFARCDLVFFDPDNGLEVRSTPRGRKNSSKYLYWDEVCATFRGGSSVMVYQHFPFEKREAYIARMTEELRQRTQASAVSSFKTPHVLFLLASQESHVAAFRAQLAAIRSFWSPKQIVAEEHSATGALALQPSP
jgi:hypothetical protein